MTQLQATCTVDGSGIRRNGGTWKAMLCILLIVCGSSTAWAQSDTCNDACMYCRTVAAAAMIGCALSQGDCAAIPVWAQACEQSANALPPSPPPPPEPSTPCFVPEPSRIGKRSASNGATPCIIFVDPFADLINAAGTDLVRNPTQLARLGQEVRAVAADSAARLVVRIYTNAVGDKVELQLVGDGGSNSRGLPDPNGQLSSILPSDGNASGSMVTLTSVQTSEGPMAFAQYHPPGDFSRSQADDAEERRWVTFEATSRTTGGKNSAEVSIERPPVVLVHGLWGKSDNWSKFTKLTKDSRFTVRLASYDNPLDGRIFQTEPEYSTGIPLVGVTASQIGFEYNAPRVLSGIRNVIDQYRQRGIAVAQADVVAHSMGGLVTRTLENRPDYLGRDNFRSGYVHKLITIGTPHLGSPLADQLLSGSNNRVRKLLSVLGGSFSFVRADIDGTYWSGGVADLRGAPLSEALANIQRPNGHEVPTATVVGRMTDRNWASVDAPVGAAQIIRSLCGGEPLADNLTSVGWFSMIMGDHSDAIVPVLSQKNGGNAAAEVPGIVHSEGVPGLGFTGPGELDENDVVPREVIRLLNEPILSAVFTRLP